MTTDERNTQILNAKLEALELESRRILRALRWSSKVRLILIIALILFVIVFSFLFYRLYNEIRDTRIAEVQRIINEQPQEFSEPLTRQLIVLAQDQGPYVGTVFREQIEEDSQKYVDAFDIEREEFVANMQTMLEDKLDEANAAVMEEHETILRREFPELVDDKKMELIKENMQEIYTQVGKRYYVDFMGDRLKAIVGKLDTFPASTPRQPGAALSEQIATEMLELVRMMVIYSDNYVPPVDEEKIAPQVSSAATAKAPPANKTGDDAEMETETAEGNPSNKDAGDSAATEDDAEEGESTAEDDGKSGEAEQPAESDEDDGKSGTEEGDSKSGDDG